MKTTDFQNGIFVVLCLTLCNTVLGKDYVKKIRIGCDNKNLTLRCSKSYPTINLNQATLQILAIPSKGTLCPSSSNTVSQNGTNCGKEDVLRFMHSKCNGKNSTCKLLVKSKEIGNHCEGVLNYKVIYMCMAGPTATPKTANATTTAQDTPPTKPTINPTEKPGAVEKDYKATILLPSLSVEIPNHDRTSPDDIFAAKVTPRFETSQNLQLHTATKHKFPATPSSEEDWGDTLDPVSKTSTRLKITFLKTCAKLVPISSEILQNSQPKEPKTLTTTKAGKKRNNDGSRLSVTAFLGKLAFVCIWFNNYVI